VQNDKAYDINAICISREHQNYLKSNELH